MYKIKFQVYREVIKSGYFEWNDEYEKLFQKLDELNKLHQSDARKKINGLRELIETCSEFYPALTELGNHFYKKHQIKIALAYYQKSYEICNKIIPIKYRGDLDYKSTIVFKDTVHSLISCHLHLKQFKKTLPLFFRLWQLNERHDIGYKVGYIYLIIGNKLKAEKLYKQDPNFIPFLYLYSLFLFTTKRYGESIVRISKLILLDELLFRNIAYKENNTSRWERFVEFYPKVWAHKRFLKLLDYVYNHPHLLLVREKYKQLTIRQQESRLNKTKQKYENEKQKLLEEINTDFANIILTKYR